jgi:hypothetical protein
MTGFSAQTKAGDTSLIFLRCRGLGSNTIFGDLNNLASHLIHLPTRIEDDGLIWAAISDVLADNDGTDYSTRIASSIALITKPILCGSKACVWQL